MEIKKELIIKSPPAKVFQAITDPEQLAKWFPDVASLEPKVGGKISFRFLHSETEKMIGKEHLIEGEIIELEKNKKIVYTWGYPKDPKFPLTRVSWTLQEIGIGMTKVTITHTGFTDETVRNTYNDGWSWFVGRLSMFAIPQKPVSMRQQIISTLIPGVDLFAFYRIKKLQKSILYIFLPTVVLAVFFIMLTTSFGSYVENNPDAFEIEELNIIAGVLLFAILGTVLVIVALTNYFIHKWSEEWNKQFLET